MRKTSVYLFMLVLYWLFMLQALLQAQSLPQFEHSQTMHQYILREAYNLLQRESPGMASRLQSRIGTTDAGTQPWERKTVMAGVWREDEEDIVYGHGGPNSALQPGLEIERSGTCLEFVYDQLKSQFQKDPTTTAGYRSISHFWDPDAVDKVLRKRNVRMDGDFPLNCLDTDDQRFEIRPEGNAWEKIQRLLRPNWQLVVRDLWWTAGEQMYNANGALCLTLPTKNSAIDEIRIRYNTLADLYNTGICTVEIQGLPFAVPVVLTAAQRERYVWEILGRACHLLADMSVPAHTHKDMHMGNISISKPIAGIVVRVTIEDDDSYESWIGSPVNAWWTADRIQGGLIPLTGQPDPLLFLMSSMRSLAASFASDDYDGVGAYITAPRSINEIPNRHNIPATISTGKRNLMIAIRDNTLPYAIRATATLLDWFVAQLNMPEDYKVWTVGASGYYDFFVRANHTQPFPTVGTMTGTGFHKQVGDELSLRSHIAPHPVTASKFFNWGGDNKRSSIKHQWDDYVHEDQGDLRCMYFGSEVNMTPSLTQIDEMAIPLTSRYPLFKNPWQVDPSMSTAWKIEQPDRFEDYKPSPAADANGGIFLNIYDDLKPPTDYYSMRASMNLDQYSKAHKSAPLETGDFAFTEWEAISADLFPDPKNVASPALPAYPDRDGYDTKIVDFMDKSAVVNAHYKKHRTSDRVLPPTNINSQRKVAQDANGVYHAVYESSNRIWYVKSTDRGVTWSREERVSDNALKASRPSIATAGGSAWVTFVTEDAVLVNIKGKNGWETIYTAPITMKNECTPAIAVLPDYSGAADRGNAICVVWEDLFVLRFAVINGLTPMIDNEILANGNGQPGSLDQPRFPSIAATSKIPTLNSHEQDFHIAWLEHGSVFYAKLSINRSQKPFTLSGWRPGGAINIETVHARTGTVGIAYPARHAPSIAVTEEHTVHVAYDVQNWFSIWPVNGTNVGTPTNPLGTSIQSMFAIRERGLPTLTGPTWQTTGTFVGGSSLGNALCSPSIAAKPATPVKGSKSNALRIPYNDAQGQVRVVRLDGTLRIDHHVEGWDPSMTVWASKVDGLVDVYSYTAQQPYSWHMLSSQNNLAKPASGNLLRMRQVLLSSDEAFASLGIAHPRLISNQTARDIEWNEAHDSLVIGVNTTLADKMRTAVFTPSAGEKMLVDIERFGINNTGKRAEILLRINDASSGEALRVVSIPVAAFASGAAMAVQELDLSAIAGTAVFMSADLHDAGEGWFSAVADRYAIAEDMSDGSMDKSGPVAMIQRPVLKQNHPNPFNPSTTISYTLPAAGPVRLAIYNILGAQVAVLQDGWLSAGQHEARFDGSEMTSGVYIYRLEAGGAIQTRSMHLVK